MEETLLVIADDLTGANDTAVMFAEAGFNTILKTKISALAQIHSDKAQVISVSTDSRAIGEKAKEQTQIAINNAIQNQPKPEQALKLGRALIVVTSIHETSQLQVNEYISTLGGKSIVFNPSPSQLINYSQSEHSLKLQLNALIRFSKDNVIIRANPAKVVNAKSANITETANNKEPKAAMF